MKSILVIEKPNNCLECSFNFGGYCMARGIIKDYRCTSEGCPKYCPLVDEQTFIQNKTEKTK